MGIFNTNEFKSVINNLINGGSFDTCLIQLLTYPFLPLQYEWIDKNHRVTHKISYISLLIARISVNKL